MRLIPTTALLLALAAPAYADQWGHKEYTHTRSTPNICHNAAGGVVACDSPDRVPEPPPESGK